MKQHRASEYVGKTINYFKVLGPAPRSRSGTVAQAQCVCGEVRRLRMADLVEERVKSCGCQRGELVRSLKTKHGGSRRGEITPEYKAWNNMISRCENRRLREYPQYGGRGIAVCEEWRLSFAAFLAHVGRRPSDVHTLDRIDTNKNYEPGNVRWIPQDAQKRNMRKNRRIEFQGQSLCLSEWSRITGLHRQTIADRLDAGWTPERALTTPRPERSQRETQELT